MVLLEHYHTNKKAQKLVPIIIKDLISGLVKYINAEPVQRLNEIDIVMTIK